MTLASTRYVTFEEYLTDPNIDPHSEWVDGTVSLMHAVADRHDEYTGWLHELLRPYLRRMKLGRLLSEPFVMKLTDPPVGRSPDLMFVAAAHLDRIRRNHLAGPADLVIEVISPATRVQDCVHKLAEYERGGVPEYWLIDPEDGAAEFHRRGDDRRLHVISPEAGIYRTPPFPQAFFHTDWLAQRPLPDPSEIWRQWGLRF